MTRVSQFKDKLKIQNQILFWDYLYDDDDLSFSTRFCLTF